VFTKLHYGRKIQKNDLQPSGQTSNQELTGKIGKRGRADNIRGSATLGGTDATFQTLPLYLEEKDSRDSHRAMNA